MHVIVGYSMHKIQAAVLVFCICRAAFTLAVRFYVHLPRGFCICRMAYTLAARFLHFAVWLLT